ncbi:MAG: hypothetical protein IPL86_16785 [Flavobacteriales bacterium]|nr:hypothetical protein [Flavobacteriales bacterium]
MKATDACGNESFCVQKITVQDIVAPVLTGAWPADQTGVNACMPSGTNAPDNATIAALYTDACGGAITVTQNTVAGSNSNCSWSFVTTYTVKDACNNTVSPSPTYTYSGGDNSAPVITGTIAPGTVAGCDASAAPAAVTTVAALEGLGLSILDNCTADGDLVVTSSDAAAGSCPIVITRTYTVTDACGKFSTYEQTINVNDNTAPVLTCAADETIGCDESTDPSNTGSSTATDNCGTPTVTYSDAAGQLLPSTFPGGTALQGRARWGNSGFEGALYIGGTVGPNLNPAGTPVWVIGTAYKFEYAYNGTTGDQTLSIDFNGDLSYGAGEVITQPTAFAGQGFKHFSIFMSGNATRGITLNNFVVNGVNLGNFVSPATGSIDKDWENSAGLFSNVTATGTITFTGSPGTGDKTGRIWFRTATPVIIPPAPICPQNYVVNRVWKATDACGNESFCVQKITVQDIVAPVLTGAWPADQTGVNACMPSGTNAPDNATIAALYTDAWRSNNGNAKHRGGQQQQLFMEFCDDLYESKMPVTIR